MAQLQTLTALDIGSSKIVCAIVELSPDGGLEVVARGVVPCKGVSDGVVVDSAETVDAIVKAVAETEASGYSVGPVVVGLTSENLTFRTGHGVTAVGNKEGEITLADKERAQASASLVGVPSDHEIISMTTRSFSVDGQNDIINPVGLTGVRLEAEAYVCTAPLTYVQNVRRVVDKAGLEIRKDGLLPASMASALAVLTDEERDVGALVLDIGMGTVDLAVYTKEIGYSAVLAKGGRVVAGDVASYFNITKSEAERLVTEYGIAAAEYLDAKEAEVTISATSTAGDSQVSVSRKELADVIDARLQEVIDWVKEQMEAARKRGLVISGVVMTGGGSLLPAIDRRFSKELGVAVRVAAPCCLANLPEYLASPIYATAVGLLAFGAHLIKQSSPENEDGETPVRRGPMGWFWRIIDWFGRMFT
ncbi:MAG: cell division protein FtsA [bacterium]|nr:cell division protein FtsA [bacterium]